MFYNNLDHISGCAIKPINGTVIDKVEITIKDLNDNLYWDGYDWSSGSEIWLLTFGTIDWSYDP